MKTNKLKMDIEKKTRLLLLTKSLELENQKLNKEIVDLKKQLKSSPKEKGSLNICLENKEVFSIGLGIT